MAEKERFLRKKQLRDKLLFLCIKRAVKAVAGEGRQTMALVAR
jgi:hypothetical protein